jgi:hypothetical protein
MAPRFRARHMGLFASLALSVSLPVVGCVYQARPHPAPAPQVVVVHEGGGPPPHAPAHGYRRKQKDAHGELELSFDAGLGVYVVVGFPNLYFYGDHYFRLADAGWQISVRHDSGFVAAAERDVPPGLRAKGKRAKKGHPVPARRRD